MTELKRNNIRCYCKFCIKENLPRALCTWRAKYRAHDHQKHFACDAHKHLIEDTDPTGRLKYHHSPEGQKAHKEAQRKMDSHLTEADYQTWMRL